MGAINYVEGTCVLGILGCWERKQGKSLTLSLNEKTDVLGKGKVERMEARVTIKRRGCRERENGETERWRHICLLGQQIIPLICRTRTLVLVQRVLRAYLHLGDQYEKGYFQPVMTKILRIADLKNNIKCANNLATSCREGEEKVSRAGNYRISKYA